MLLNESGKEMKIRSELMRSDSHEMNGSIESTVSRPSGRARVLLKREGTCENFVATPREPT